MLILLGDVPILFIYQIDVKAGPIDRGQDSRILSEILEDMNKKRGPPF